MIIFAHCCLALKIFFQDHQVIFSTSKRNFLSNHFVINSSKRAILSSFLTDKIKIVQLGNLTVSKFSIAFKTEAVLLKGKIFSSS